MVRKIVAASVLTLGLTMGAAGVAGAQDSPGPSVAPNVIERPLPATGSDVGADVIVGLSLTAAGLAFAATARQRRRRFEAATPTSDS